MEPSRRFQRRRIIIPCLLALLGPTAAVAREAHVALEVPHRRSLDEPGIPQLPSLNTPQLPRGPGFPGQSSVLPRLPGASGRPLDPTVPGTPQSPGDSDPPPGDPPPNDNEGQHNGTDGEIVLLPFLPNVSMTSHSKKWPIVIRGGGITITNSDPDDKPQAAEPPGDPGLGPSPDVPDQATNGQQSPDLKRFWELLGEDAASDPTGIPATCPLPVPTVGPVCGNILASVTITDFGNGTCTAQARDPSKTPPLVDTGDCTGTLFHGATCGAFHGTINLRASNPNNLLNGEYRPPDFQRYLTAAGLGNLTVAGTVLLRYEGPGTFPKGGQTPSFLPKLEYADSFTVEDTTSSVFRQPEGLPGATRLLQIQDQLEVKGTGLANLRSFGGLRCAPHILRIIDNPQLNSLAGLESIQSSAGLQQIILKSGGLASREGLSPLGAALDCPTGAQGSPGAPANVSSFSVKIATSDPELRDAASFCKMFVQDMQSGTSGSPAGAPLARQSTSADASLGAPAAERRGTGSRDVLPGSQSAAAPLPEDFAGPAECPMKVPVINPQCGNASTTITMSEYGNGTCHMEMGNAENARSIQAWNTCEVTLFGKATCGSFPGTLKLLASNPGNRSADTYLEPDFQRYLETVGIGAVQSAGSVTFQVEGDNPIPIDLNPYFLPKLKYAVQYTIQDLTSPGRITFIPSAHRLTQVSRLLTVIGTRMSNLTSLSGLTCPPNITQIVGNKRMTTLRGLEGVRRAPKLSQLTISNPLVDTPLALSPLAGYLGCAGTESYVDVAAVSVLSGGCPRAFSPASAVCAYIGGDGVCSPAAKKQGPAADPFVPERPAP